MKSNLPDVSDRDRMKMATLATIAEGLPPIVGAIVDDTIAASDRAIDSGRCDPRLFIDALDYAFARSIANRKGYNVGQSLEFCALLLEQVNAHGEAATLRERAKEVNA